MRGTAAEGLRRVEVAVIGGGYTGLTAALYLARAGIDVAVFEVAGFGEGASAINFGSVSPVAPVAPGGSHPDAGRFARMAVEFLAGFVEREALPCSWGQPGHITLARSATEAARLEQAYAVYWRHFPGAVALLSPADVAENTAAAGISCGLLHRGFVLIDAKSLFEALLARAAAADVRLVAHTRITSLSTGSSGVSLTCDRGVIAAGQVLVCADAAWSLLPEPVRDQVRLGTSYLGQTGRLMPDEQALISSHRRVFGTAAPDRDYFRLNADGALLFGSRLGLQPACEPSETTALLQARMARLFPALPWLRLQSVRSGPIGFTEDALPRLGQEGRVAWAGGYCGSGIAAAIVCGHALAQLAQGRRDPTGLYAAAASHSIVAA